MKRTLLLVLALTVLGTTAAIADGPGDIHETRITIDDNWSAYPDNPNAFFQQGIGRTPGHNKADVVLPPIAGWKKVRPFVSGRVLHATYERDSPAGWVKMRVTVRARDSKTDEWWYLNDDAFIKAMEAKLSQNRFTPTGKIKLRGDGGSSSSLVVPVSKKDGSRGLMAERVVAIDEELCLITVIGEWPKSRSAYAKDVSTLIDNIRIE